MTLASTRSKLESRRDKSKARLSDGLHYGPKRLVRYRQVSERGLWRFVSENPLDGD